MTDHLHEGFDPPILEEGVGQASPAPITLLDDLEAVVFKLRAFTESAEGDYGLGVEMGMQRAADMIENAISRSVPRRD